MCETVEKQNFTVKDKRLQYEELTKNKDFKEHNAWNCSISQRKQKYHDKRWSAMLQDTGCIPDNHAREKRKRAKHH